MAEARTSLTPSSTPAAPVLLCGLTGGGCWPLKGAEVAWSPLRRMRRGFLVLVPCVLPGSWRWEAAEEEEEVMGCSCWGLCPSLQPCLWKLGRPCVPFQSHPSSGCHSCFQSTVVLILGYSKERKKLQIYWNYLDVILFSCGVSGVKGVSILLTPINIKPLLLIGFAYGKEEDWPLNSLNKANLKKNNFS